MKATGEQDSPRKVGRPRKELSPEEVEKLTRIGCTDEEIAGWAGVSIDTVIRRRKDDPDFAYHYEKGKSAVRMSLRRKQLAVANEGNATMLIWLGKQLLEQKDRSESTNTHEIVTPEAKRRAAATRALEKALSTGISEDEARAQLVALGVSEDVLSDIPHRR